LQRSGECVGYASGSHGWSLSAVGLGARAGAWPLRRPVVGHRAADENLPSLEIQHHLSLHLSLSLSLWLTLQVFCHGGDKPRARFRLFVPRLGAQARLPPSAQPCYTALSHLRCTRRRVRPSRVSHGAHGTWQQASRDNLLSAPFLPLSRYACFGLAFRHPSWPDWPFIGWVRGTSGAGPCAGGLRSTVTSLSAGSQQAPR